MNTVQKNNNITRKQVQELLEENQEKLGLSDKNLKKLIKSMRSHTISRQMRKIFYQECLKKIKAPNYIFKTVLNDSSNLYETVEAVNSGKLSFAAYADYGDNIKDGDVSFNFILALFCGIYMIYWNYKMGQKIYEAGQRYNKSISDNSVLYLVLSLFGLQIVNYALMQSDLNKFSNK